MMTEEEVRTMKPARLAEYALENDISSYVAETIKTNEIDGDVAYELNEEAISEIAGKSVMQKKKLLSAVHKLPHGANARGGGTKPTTATKEESMLTDVFQSYNEHSYALLFACNKYPNENSLKKLDCAVADGKLMEKTLKAHGFKILGTHYDEGCTKANIEKELIGLMGKFPYDKKLVGRLYLMFAGHGLKDKISGSSVFCCHDYNHEPGTAYSTSYPLSELKAKIQRIGIKHITLHFDCCHAGGIFLANRAREVDFNAETMANKPSVSAITSVTADEEALERGGNGLFTKSVCKWLDPEKRFVFDRFNSDYVTMTDLFRSVGEEVSTEARESGGQMTPMKKDIQQQHMDEQCAGEMLFFAPQAWEAYRSTGATATGGASGRGRGTTKESLARAAVQGEDGAEDAERKALRKQLEAEEKKKLEMKQQLEAMQLEEEKKKKKKREEEEEEAKRLAADGKQPATVVDWNAVERVVGKEAADQMKQGAGLGTLYLINKSITAEGCRTIAPALRTMTNLKTLNLQNNNIGDEGCRTIAPALRTMPNLKNLSLQKNNIGDEGLAVLSNVVPAIPMLDQLNLDDNKIGNVGCQCLLELIENDSLQSLTCLRLEKNRNISSEELKTKFKRVWSEKGENPYYLHF